MYRGLRAFTAAALVVSAFGIVPSFAQKSGGILRVHAIDSPPSLSMHEEIDAVPARATMGVFNMTGVRIGSGEFDTRFPEQLL